MRPVNEGCGNARKKWLFVTPFPRMENPSSTETDSEEATGSPDIQVQENGNHADNEELIGSRGSGPGSNRP
jgi:hypothetical protein